MAYFNKYFQKKVELFLGQSIGFPLAPASSFMFPASDPLGLYAAVRAQPDWEEDSLNPREVAFPRLQNPHYNRLIEGIVHVKQNISHVVQDA